MYDLLSYSFEVFLMMSFLYMAYYLFLRNENMHALNRGVLLFILLFSFVLPFIHLSFHRTIETPYLMESQVVERETDISPLPGAEELIARSISTIVYRSICLLYILGCVISFLLYFHAYLGTLHVVNKCNCMYGRSGMQICSTDRDISPFCWFNRIVVRTQDLSDKMIVRHELAHLKKLHSIDRLLADLCVSLQWFNPVVWSIKNDLIRIHEYQADEEVLRNNVKKKDYKLLIFNRMTESIGSGAKFGSSFLEERYRMMDNRKAGVWRKQKVWSVVIVAMVALLFQSQMTRLYVLSPQSYISDANLREAVRSFEYSYIESLRSNGNTSHSELYIGYTEERLKKDDINRAEEHKSDSETETSSTFVFYDGDEVILRQYYPLSNATIADHYYMRETGGQGVVRSIRQLRKNKDAENNLYSIRSHYLTLNTTVVEEKL